MSRSYEREGKHYDFALLSHLVETGQATFFEGPSIFVIKTEDGTVAVRPHQVLFTPTPAPFRIVEVEVSPEGDRPAGGKRSWVSASEEDEILGYFGI